MTGSLLATWSAQDPAAAASWAGSLPDPAWRDQSLSELAQDIATRNTPLAIQLADQITNPAIRAQSVSQLQP
jgi:hypothetical protein